MFSFLFGVMVWIQLQSIPDGVQNFHIYWGNSPGSTANQVVVPRGDVGGDRKVSFDIDTLAAPRYVTVSAVNSFGEGPRSNEIPMAAPAALVIEDAGA